MTDKPNKNDVPLKNLSELEANKSYNELPHKDKFLYLFNIVIVLDKKKKKLKVNPVNTNNSKDLMRKGLVYILVINNKILTIGSSTNSIVDRVQSYNAGKKKHRKSGTASTTNYYILQSIINIGEIVNVYAHFPLKKKYVLFGKEGKDIFPSAQVIKNRILADFKKVV